MRKNQKLLDANKGMNDYNWERLYQEEKLKRLNVSVWDMYIREKNMKVPKGMLKKGKLELVTADIARSGIKRLTTAERTEEHEDNEAITVMKRRKMLFFNKLAMLTVTDSVIAVVTATTI